MARWLSRALVAAALLVAALLGGEAAQAHPFGDPQRVEIGGQGDTVRIRWAAAGDDLTALALHLRVLDDQRSFVYQDGALVPEESDRADAVVLAQAPEFTDYLLERIEVRGGDGECAGRVTSTEDLIADGARLTFTCPGAAPTAQVAVRTLVDIHPAYRTLASADGGQRQVYTADAAVFEWRLTGAGGGLARSAAVQISAIAVGTLGVPAAALLVWRRRRGRRS